MPRPAPLSPLPARIGLPLLLGLLAVGALAAPARADALEVEARDAEPAAEPPPTRPSHFERRPSAFLLNMGLGGPTGLLGVMFETAAVPWLAWQAGAGISIGGPRLSTALRPQVAFEEWAVGFGLGLSTGRAQKGGVLPFDQALTIEQAWWVEADAQVMKRTADGWSLNMAFGLSHLLNPEDCMQDDTPCAAVGERLDSGPHLSVGVGKAF